LVADGLRNPFGLAFAPDGQLYVAENGPDDRGSRPIWGAGDVLWRITPGTWYGWPDFAEGRAITYETYKPPHKKQPTNLLAQHPGTPPKPAAVLGVHASADGLDFSRSPAFGYAGEAFVAEFGDQAPVVGKVMHPVGYRVVRVNVNTGRIEDFAVNKGRHNGPASKNENGGLERLVAVRFSPSGDALYVVDFGVMLETSKNSQPQQNTGVLWRISRTGS
jgi:glucose/arabinose dehydrogenase